MQPPHLKEMSGGDLVGALPDHVLEHVLSFLPSPQAVQSSVLARRWRHLWRSTPAIRVPFSDANYRIGLRPRDASLFVSRFLLLRDGVSPLRLFEIDIDLTDENGHDDVTDTIFYKHRDQWIRHAASTCHTFALATRAHYRPYIYLQGGLPFASLHLKTLHLHNVELFSINSSLDFSHCPALLHLTLSNCNLHADAIVSPSLLRLSITGCSFDFHPKQARTETARISTPSLRWLQLSDVVGKAPSLEIMPSLTTAIVRLSSGGRGSGHRSVLLHGVSEATSLELTASSSDGMAILQRDLTWCPTFSKLKTLVLNEWCVCNNVPTLPCLLRHSPIIEKLTIELSKSPLKVKTKESYITSKQSFLTFEHLKIVEIKCQEVGPKVDKTLKTLSACGIPLHKINIQRTKQSECAE